MDLANLNLTEMASKGAWLTITHPMTGDETDIKIKLAGKDSPAWRRVVKDYRTKTAAKFIKNPNAVIDNTDKLGWQCLAAVTIEWRNVILNGQPVACTPENAYQLYSNPDFEWLVDQVDDFVGNRANFGATEQLDELPATDGTFDALARVAGIEGNS